MSRYFTNPTKWVDADGRFNRIVEAGEGTNAHIHLPVEGRVESWDYIGKASGKPAQQRALEAMERHNWIELTYHEAFPDRAPQTTNGLIW